MRRVFPKGFIIPESLLRFYEFHQACPDFYSGHFELMTDGPQSALAFFDGDAKAALQFAVFGHDSSDSLYAFWLYKDKSGADAPIVYLGAEGGGEVISNSFEEFLGLLAVGGDDGEFDSQSAEPAKELPKFRKWLKTEFEISRPRNPSRIMEQARKKHRDLGEWMLAWQKSHFGK